MKLKKWTFFISFSRQGWLIFLWFLPKIHKKVRSNHENDEKNHQTKSKFYIVFFTLFQILCPNYQKKWGTTFQKVQKSDKYWGKRVNSIPSFSRKHTNFILRMFTEKVGVLRFQNLEGIDTKVLELWDNHGFLVRVTPLNSEKWVHFFHNHKVNLIKTTHSKKWYFPIQFIKVNETFY